MMSAVYVFIILSVSIFPTNMADSAQSKDTQEQSSTAKNIFIPPNESNISQIKNTTTPWVMPDLIPTIQQFKKNVFEGFKSSSAVQKVLNMTFDSKTIRDDFFNRPYRFLPGIGHRATAALSNIISKSSSFFEQLSVRVYLESQVINLAEFLLSFNVVVDDSISQRYVEMLSSEVAKADLSSEEKIFQATLEGYRNFVKSFKFDFGKKANHLLLLFSSTMIILHEK